MKIQIKVTKEILRRSMMCGTMDLYSSDQGIAVAANCAVALAVREIAPNAWVQYGHIEWNYFDESPIALRPTSLLPSIASKFIEEFDELLKTPEKRLELPELSFEVDFPEEMVEKIGISELKEILSKSEVLAEV